MANHCYNFVSIEGDPDILRFIEGLIEKADGSSTNYFVDFCDKVLQKKPRTDQLDTYNDYGTKWWEQQVSLVEGDDTMTIQGDSAWGPPDRFIEELCKEYGLCATLEYEEPGCGFAGIAKYDSTGEIEHEEMTYHEFSYGNDVSYWIENLAYTLHGNDMEYILEELKNISYASDEDKKLVIEEINELNKENNG